MPHELLLLSPYRPPTLHALNLGALDTACWLNGWLALWHPAALRIAASLPRWLGPYDQNEPGERQLFAVPESPPLHLPVDWDDAVGKKGGATFRAKADRGEALSELQAALGELGYDTADFADDPNRVRACFGLGLGYQVIETLFEAMEREPTWDRPAFWADLQRGCQSSDWLEPLRAAAQKLLAVRDTLYSAPIHWLNFAFPGPAAFRANLGRCTNWISSGRALESLAAEEPGRIEQWRSKLAGPADADNEKSALLEPCTAGYMDRADDLLPVESQLWNLRRGREAVRKLLGADARVYASPLSAWHAQSPRVLQRAGLSKCVFVAFDDAKLPSHRAAVIQWPAADGRQVEAYCRAPLPVDDPQTFFHIAHYLHETIMNDSTAVIGFVCRDEPAAVYSDDFRALEELAPVLGESATISHFLRDATIGEYASAANADDFAIDHLDRWVNVQHPRPVSGIARHWRLRRHADAGWTWAALLRSLGGSHDAELAEHLRRFEERVESDESITSEECAAADREFARPLVQRLLAHAPAHQPGLLLLNSCGFARRMAVERDDFSTHPPKGRPIRAVQIDDGNQCRLVVDIPALGFAWIPRASDAGAAPATRSLKLAAGNVVRNDLFEAEIDAQTGGLRGFRDLRSRENRLGQQLVFQPGSVMHAKSMNVTASGPAMGEIVTEGALLDEHQTVLATFRQHFRAWLGRPILEIRIEVFPEHEPSGYPWHAYFGSRFAWRDEGATLVRGNGGVGSVTTHSRPTTPEYLEVRSGRTKTLILPQGLPFHQRHGGRMLDVVLIPPGETARSFSLALGLEREHPAQTAWGLISPIIAVPVDAGPPHVGPTGWLAHLDSPNLMLTSLRPDGEQDGIIARLLEVGGYSGSAALRWARNPKGANLVEPDGSVMMPLSIEDDTVHFDYAAYEFIEVQVEF